MVCSSISVVVQHTGVGLKCGAHLRAAHDDGHIRWGFFIRVFILYSHGHHTVFVLVFVCLIIASSTIACPSRPPSALCTPMACSSLKFDHVEDLSRGTRDNNEKSRDGCVAQGCTPRCSSVQCRTRVVEVHLLHCCMFTCGHTLTFTYCIVVCSLAAIH